MSNQTRKIILVAVIVCAVLFAVGILIGHFAIDQEGGESEAQRGRQCGSTEYTEQWANYRDGFLDKAEAQSCYAESCHQEDLPRTYLSYHLNGKTVTIDGRLDDPAWQEVPWSDDLMDHDETAPAGAVSSGSSLFTDIRGPDYPKPYFDTKFKVRWNDERLYIGAYMQETDFWGTITEDESLVWTENAFETILDPTSLNKSTEKEHVLEKRKPLELCSFVAIVIPVYAVPDGSMHNYKEMQISVRNVTWDLMLKKAYIDRPPCTSEQVVVVSNWTSEMEKATYTDGVINDVNGKGTFWTAEWSFRFDALAEFTDRAPSDATPRAGEAWFFIFARPEYKFKIVNGQYVKDTDATTEWWSWQPMYTVNLHLPSRFGLVQFKRNLADKEFNYTEWHIYRALFDVFEAEHKYKAVNGMFISALEKLDVSPKIMSKKCVEVNIELKEGDFQVNVKSRIMNLRIGHIRADRYVWFT